MDPSPEAGLTLPPGARGPSQTIDSASTIKLVDETSADLIQELDDKKRRLRRWPLGAVVLVAGLGWAFWNHVDQTKLLVLAVISVFCVGLLIWWDRYKKTTVIFYDLDAEFTNAYQRLFSAVLSVKHCARTWNINSKADVYDSKYVGGADQLLEREPTHISESGLPGIKTNVSVLTIGAGTQTLAFMPDRLLIFDTAGVGAVDYLNLNLKVQASKFIETEAVPKDAVVVGQTWQYTNKKGGPDKRFAGNRQFPIAQYEECVLHSDSGLHEAFQSSQAGPWNRVREAIDRLVALMPAPASRPVDHGVIRAAAPRPKFNLAWVGVPAIVAAAVFLFPRLSPHSTVHSAGSVEDANTPVSKAPPNAEKLEVVKSPRASISNENPLRALIEQRTWTDGKGRTLQAKLLSVNKDAEGLFVGQFQKPTGEEFEYRIGLLCTPDIEMVKRAMKASGIQF